MTSSRKSPENVSAAAGGCYAAGKGLTARVWALCFAAEESSNTIRLQPFWIGPDCRQSWIWRVQHVALAISHRSVCTPHAARSPAISLLTPSRHRKPLTMRICPHSRPSSSSGTPPSTAPCKNVASRCTHWYEPRRADRPAMGANGAQLQRGNRVVEEARNEISALPHVGSTRRASRRDRYGQHRR